MNNQEEKPGGLCEKQPYRNAVMVQAEPKSLGNVLGDLGDNKLISTATAGEPNSKVYRNNPLALAEPRSIHEADEKGVSPAMKLITPATGGPDKKAYRTSPLILAEAKSIYDLFDTGNKYLIPSGEPEPKAYRTRPTLLPEGKSIYSLEDTGNKFLQPSGEPDEKAYRTSPLVYAEPKLNNEKYIVTSGDPDKKAHRTSTLVHAEPKTIYSPDDTGNKHLQHSGFLDENKMPYRSSSFGIAAPKAVTDLKIGLGYFEASAFKHAPQTV